MKFSAGHLVCSISGNSRIVDDFERAVSFAGADLPAVDITFEFPGELPLWHEREFVSLDSFDIAADRIRVADKSFVYEAALSENPIRVLISPARKDLMRKIHHTVKKNWRYFHTHGRSGSIYYVKRFVYYIYMPMLQLALLRKGASLAHCSAIEKNGLAVIFPAWGGVGKTSIMSRFIDEGWRFISDDSCVICDDGQVFTHPLPMHIYKYHAKQSSGLVARMLENSSLTDRFLWRGLSVLKKPDKLVRWVAPVKVFGREKLCESGNISRVVHLHRVEGLANFRVEQAKPIDIAKIMTSTIIDEINGLADIAIAANSVQVKSMIPNISQVYEKISDIYSKAFSSASCFMITLPSLSNADDLYKFLVEKKLV
jgi:hypothetical protein